MNILKPDQVKSLEDSFYNKLAGPEHDKAVICLMLLKLNNYSAAAATAVKLDTLSRLHALSELLDIKRILSPTPGEDEAISDELLLRKMMEFE